MQKRMLIFGCGYSGIFIARAVHGSSMQVSGTTRTAEKLHSLREENIHPLVFDGVNLSTQHTDEMKGVTHIVQSIPPTVNGDTTAKLLLSDFTKKTFPQLESITYLSTTGVYGDHAGAWVDEKTAVAPMSVRSLERVRAEKAWNDFGAMCGVPVTILRLSGIYGPGRNAFCNFEQGAVPRRFVKKDQVFNRVRVEDIAGAVKFLQDGNHQGIYNVSDDEPAAPQDVIAEAAQLAGVPVPETQKFEDAQLSEMAKSFYLENKRISNKKLKSLGFSFQYPDYRMSLKQLWTSGTWGSK